MQVSILLSAGHFIKSGACLTPCKSPHTRLCMENSNFQQKQVCLMMHSSKSQILNGSILGRKSIWNSFSTCLKTKPLTATLKIAATSPLTSFLILASLFGYYTPIAHLFWSGYCSRLSPDAQTNLLGLLKGCQRTSFGTDRFDFLWRSSSKSLSPHPWTSMSSTGIPLSKPYCILTFYPQFLS